jgi:hypothetical protein
VTAIIFATVNVVASMQARETAAAATGAQKTLAVVGVLAIGFVFVQGFFVAQHPYSEENARIISYAVSNPLGGAIFLILNGIYMALSQWGYWRLNYWFNPYYSTGYAILLIPPIVVSTLVCVALRVSFRWRLSSALLARRLARIAVVIAVVVGLNSTSLQVEQMFSRARVPALSR